MTTPAILHTTAGMPIGGFASVPIYRVTPASVSINGTSYSVATAPAAGALSSGAALLGSYLFERLAFSGASRLVQRMGALGEDADKSLLRGSPTLSTTIQAASIGTPSLMEGDAMEVQVGMKATSTPGTPASIATSRWFIGKNGINYDAGDPTKFTVTWELDRQNSSASLAEF